MEAPQKLDQQQGSCPPPVYLHGMAFIDRTSFGTWDRLEIRKEGAGGEAPPAGLFFSSFPRYRRLDLASRFVLCASTLLPKLPNRLLHNTGVYLGTADGCLGMDLQFVDSIKEGSPKASVFLRTLPSIPGAETSIYWGYRGPSLCQVSDCHGANGAHDPSFAALVAAIGDLWCGEAEAAIAGGYQVVWGRPQDDENPATSGPWVFLATLSLHPPRTGSAYTVLLEWGDNGDKDRVEPTADCPTDGQGATVVAAGEAIKKLFEATRGRQQTPESPVCLVGRMGARSVRVRLVPWQGPVSH